MCVPRLPTLACFRVVCSRRRWKVAAPTAQVHAVRMHLRALLKFVVIKHADEPQQQHAPTMRRTRACSWVISFVNAIRKRHCLQRIHLYLTSKVVQRVLLCLCDAQRICQLFIEFQLTIVQLTVVESSLVIPVTYGGAVFLLLQV